MRDFLRSVVGLSLFRLGADLMLPDGDTGRYVDFGIGLCLMLCMLKKMIDLLRGFL